MKIILALFVLWLLKKAAQSLILWFMFDYTGALPKWYPHKISPYLFGFAVGRMPHKKDKR